MPEPLRNRFDTGWADEFRRILAIEKCRRLIHLVEDTRLPRSAAGVVGVRFGIVRHRPNQFALVLVTLQFGHYVFRHPSPAAEVDKMPPDGPHCEIGKAQRRASHPQTLCGRPDSKERSVGFGGFSVVAGHSACHHAVPKFVAPRVERDVEFMVRFHAGHLYCARFKIQHAQFEICDFRAAQTHLARHLDHIGGFLIHVLVGAPHVGENGLELLQGRRDAVDFSLRKSLDARPYHRVVKPIPFHHPVAADAAHQCVAKIKGCGSYVLSDEFRMSGIPVKQADRAHDSLVVLNAFKKGLAMFGRQIGEADVNAIRP